MTGQFNGGNRTLDAAVDPSYGVDGALALGNLVERLFDGEQPADLRSWLNGFTPQDFTSAGRALARAKAMLDSARGPAALAAFHTEMRNTIADAVKDFAPGKEQVIQSVYLGSLSAHQLDEAILLLARVLALVGVARDSLDNREQS